MKTYQEYREIIKIKEEKRLKKLRDEYHKKQPHKEYNPKNLIGCGCFYVGYGTGISDNEMPTAVMAMMMQDFLKGLRLIVPDAD